MLVIDAAALERAHFLMNRLADTIDSDRGRTGLDLVLAGMLLSVSGGYATGMGNESMHTVLDYVWFHSEPTKGVKP